MNSPVIGAKAFLVNPEAQRLHEDGLRAELDGDYNQARESFSVAQQVLSTLPDTIDREVQLARILRDEGFTHARSSIAGADLLGLDQAEEIIEGASLKTYLLILRAKNIPPEAELPSKLSRPKMRELLAEDGATMSLLGRVATATQVLLGQKDIYHPPREKYERAHLELRHGNNGYYRVSNTMAAARQERIDGNVTSAFKWLGRAAAGLAWTATFDRANTKQTVLTFGSRLSHLRSHHRAVRSVIAKP